jgi:hypothetical protein
VYTYYYCTAGGALASHVATRCQSNPARAFLDSRARRGARGADREASTRTRVLGDSSLAVSVIACERRALSVQLACEERYIDPARRATNSSVRRIKKEPAPAAKSTQGAHASRVRRGAIRESRAQRARADSRETLQLGVVSARRDIV